MRIKLFIFFICFIILSIFNIKQVYASDTPTGLSATPYCTGSDQKTAAIDFNWNTSTPAQLMRYWYSDMNGPQEITAAYVPVKINSVASSLKPVYDWYVEFCDRAVWGSPINCVRTNGQTVTSPTCPGGPPPPPPPPDNSKVYDCAHRSSSCSDLNTYPADKCRDISWNDYHNCPVPPNCIMENQSGDPSTWTRSCAFNKDQPPPSACIIENETGCFGPAGTIGTGAGTCCDNLTCEGEVEGNYIANGTCKRNASSNTCNTCPPGTDWNGSQCIDSSGNPSQPAKVDCGDQTCVQGEGCRFGGDPNAPLTQPCQGDDLNAKDGCIRIKTAFGNISTDAAGFSRWILGFFLSISGGIVVLIIIVAGYRLMTSQGEPEKVKNARDQLTAAVVGLLFIIFSLVILELITRDVLGLPGFGG